MRSQELSPFPDECVNFLERFILAIFVGFSVLHLCQQEMASLTIKAEVHAECTGRRFHFKTDRVNSNCRVALASILNCKRGSRQENITAVIGFTSRKLVYLVTRPVRCPFSTLKSRNRSSCITVVGMASAGMGAHQYVATVGAPPSIPLPSAPSGFLPANAALLFLGFIACSVCRSNTSEYSRQEAGVTAKISS